MCNFPYPSPLAMRLFAAPLTLRLFALTALASLAASFAQAQPANDRIGNATLISSDGALQRVSGSIRGATVDTEEGVPFGFYPSVWYRWVAPIAGRMQTQIRGDGFYIWGNVFRGSDISSLVNMGGSTGYWANFAQSWEEYSYDVVAGQTYYTRIENRGNLSSYGSFTFGMAQLFQQTTISDNFATRTLVAGRSFTVDGNNTSFTAEDDEPQHGPSLMAPAGKSAWLTWSTTSRSTVTITARSPGFEPALSVYSGDELTSLTRIAQSGITSQLVVPGQPRATTLTFIANPGVPYHFAVDGTRNGSGSFTFSLASATAKPGFLVRPTSTTVYSGDTAIFSAVVAGTGDISYQWERYDTATKRWVPLEDDTVYSGSTTGTLTITPTSIDMNGARYRLAVDDDIGVSYSAVATLTVTELPAVHTELLGTVNTNITLGGNLPLPTNGGVYFATGLPKGLSIDPATGIISGTIVNAKPGTYRVVYGSTDGKTRNPAQFVLQIVVAPFSPALLGSFEVLLNRASDGLPAGKITLRTATNGNYTGSYFDLSQGRGYSFRGRLQLDENARTAGTVPDAPVQVSRGRALEPLSLQFLLSEPVGSDPDAVTILAAVLRDSLDNLVAQGFDGARVGVFKSATPAPWAGRYTVRLTDQIVVGLVDPVAVPYGSGYATANINSAGTLALRARLADNTPVTANLASSRQGTYRAAQRVYGAGGSLSGRIAITEEITSDFITRSYHVGADSDSRLYWRKPARPRDRLYPDGFGDAALGLSFRMQPWTNASNAFLVRLGLSETGEFKFNLASDTVNNDSLTVVNFYQLPVTAFLSQSGKVTYPAGNPTNFSISFNAGTGEFKGSFRLSDEPLPGSTKPLVRNVTFSGVLFQLANAFQGDVIGEGFFLLPPLAPDILRTSGLIELRAGPPDSPFIVTGPPGSP